MNKNPLIGRMINAIEMTSDKLAIKFVMADGEDVTACVDADCCSYTWVEHISLPAGGFPAFVFEAGDVDMPDLEGEGSADECDVIQYYGFELKTDKGHMLIDYRNSSNGYYGGSLTWPGESHNGGVYSQNVANDEWVAVTQDL